jgi:hypothetical protein
MMVPLVPVQAVAAGHLPMLVPATTINVESAREGMLADSHTMVCPAMLQLLGVGSALISNVGNALGVGRAGTTTTGRRMRFHQALRQRHRRLPLLLRPPPPLLLLLLPPHRAVPCLLLLLLLLLLRLLQPPLPRSLRALQLRQDHRYRVLQQHREGGHLHRPGFVTITSEGNATVAMLAGFRTKGSLPIQTLLLPPEAVSALIFSVADALEAMLVGIRTLKHRSVNPYLFLMSAILPRGVGEEACVLLSQCARTSTNYTFRVLRIRSICGADAFFLLMTFRMINRLGRGLKLVLGSATISNVGNVLVGIRAGLHMKVWLVLGVVAACATTTNVGCARVATLVGTRTMVQAVQGRGLALVELVRMHQLKQKLQKLCGRMMKSKPNGNQTSSNSTRLSKSSTTTGCGKRSAKPLQW